MPTPIVAYAVKELSCSSGIVITASHNPSKYNGYKCYDERGYQMTDEAAERTLQYINNCDIFEDVKTCDFEKAVEEGKIQYIEEGFLDKYFELVLSRSINPEVAKNTDLSVIYTPLNGTGNKPVRRILSMMGIQDVTVVPVQENPDGRFPTCSFPNPEIREAFNEALKLAETKKADLLLATDPDCDRVGIAVKDADGQYVLLSGNETGMLLLDYICSQRVKHGAMPEEPVMVKTIVTMDMGERIAASYGVKTVNVTLRTGQLVCMKAVNGDEDCMIMTDSGIVIRISLKQVSVYSRSAQGVKVINVKDDQRVSTVAVLEPEEIEEISEESATE